MKKVASFYNFKQLKRYDIEGSKIKSKDREMTSTLHNIFEHTKVMRLFID